MTVPGHRFERLAEEIRDEINLMLAGELKDPRIEVAQDVSEVRLSPDMRQVRVFVEVTGSQSEQAEAIEGLRNASGFIRHELVERLHLRRAPEIHFTLDDSEERARRIAELLEKTTVDKAAPEKVIVKTAGESGDPSAF